jgi:predicted HicB family RNase H-like nuclease
MTFKLQNKKDSKTLYLQIRVSAEEHQKAQDLAEYNGVPMSKWIVNKITQAHKRLPADARGAK